jgi:hypothetical protein
MEGTQSPGSALTHQEKEWGVVCLFHTVPRPEQDLEAWVLMQGRETRRKPLVSIYLQQSRSVRGRVFLLGGLVQNKTRHCVLLGEAGV